MEDSDIRITFETLFELLRVEKKRGEIQPMPPGFMQDVHKYIEHKQSVQGKEVLGVDELERSRNQLEQVFKILQELFAVRERKLLELARQKTDGLTQDGFLADEVEFFNQICVPIKEFRAKFQFKAPSAQPVPIQSAPEPTPESPPAPSAVPPVPEPAVAVAEEPTKLMITSPIPRFMGSAMEVYGPFSVGDMVDLPEDIEKLLVNKSLAKRT